MADYTVTSTLGATPPPEVIYSHHITPTTSTSNRTEITRGETVEFALVYNPNGSGNVTWELSGQSTFTNNNDITLTSASGVTRTISASAPLGDYYIEADPPFSYGSNQRWHYTVVASVDDIVDAFDLGTLTNVAPSTVFDSIIIDVLGIDSGQDCTASIETGAGTFRIRAPAGSWGSYSSADKTVQLDYEIQVRLTSSSSLSTAVTTTLRITGDFTSSYVEDILSITTYATATDDSEVQFPTTSLPISLLDVKNFFGGSGNLSAYHKGSGGLLPNIASNSGVPSGVPINLSDLVGAWNRFYWATLPPNKSDSADSTGGPVTASVTFNTSDWDIGFGTFGDSAEYKFELDFTVNGGASMTPSSGYGTWGSTSSLKIAVGASQAEKFAVGIITIYARHTSYTTETEISCQASFSVTVFK